MPPPRHHRATAFTAASRLPTTPPCVCVLTVLEDDVSALLEKKYAGMEKVLRQVQGGSEKANAEKEARGEARLCSSRWASF